MVAKGLGSATYLCRWKAKQWQVFGHGGFDRPRGWGDDIHHYIDLTKPPDQNHKLGALEDVRSLVERVLEVQVPILVF